MLKSELKEKVWILSEEVDTLNARILYLERYIEILKGGTHRAICSKCDMSFTALKANAVGSRWTCFECLDKLESE